MYRYICYAFYACKTTTTTVVRAQHTITGHARNYLWSELTSRSIYTHECIGIIGTYHIIIIVGSGKQTRPRATAAATLY